jgi:two-component system sensor histidine kinase YesM
MLLPLFGLVLALGPWTEQAFRLQAATVSSQFSNQTVGYIQLYLNGIQDVQYLLLESPRISQAMNRPQIESFFDVVELSWDVGAALRSFAVLRTDIQQIDLYGISGFTYVDSRPSWNGFRQTFLPQWESLQGPLEITPDGRVANFQLRSSWYFEPSSSSLVLEQLLVQPFTNRLWGGLRALLPVHRIENVLERFRIGNNSFITLVARDTNDSYHVVRTRLGSRESQIAQEALVQIDLTEFQLALQPQSIEVEFNTSGQRFLSLITPIVGTSVMLMTVVSIDELLTPIERIRVSYVIVLLVGALASFFLVNSASRKFIILPIEHLKSHMTLVHTGQESQPRAHVETQDEIGDLARTYNKMLDNIDNLLFQIREEEFQRNEAEWAALQAQINPHFLYNTLDSISWLARAKEVPQIVEMTVSLAKLFKYTFAESKTWVKVKDELAQIQQYLTIQKHRYGERMNLIWQIESDTEEHLIPKFILQPIVENALQHGLEPLNEKVDITIRSYLRDKKLIFEVQDSGIGVTDEKLDQLNGFVRVINNDKGDLLKSHDPKSKHRLVAPNEELNDSKKKKHIGLAYVANRIAQLTRGQGHIGFGQVEPRGLLVRIQLENK